MPLCWLRMMCVIRVGRAGLVDLEKKVEEVKVTVDVRKEVSGKRELS